MSWENAPRLVEDPECWTPRLVKLELIAAITWARYSVSPVGPSQIRSTMPAYKASLDDHLDEGWGLPELAEGVPDEAQRLYVSPPADRVQALIEALEWVAHYVALTNQGSARMLNLWLRCRVYKLDFDWMVGELGLSRGHAYRLRDRALSLIAQGLDRDGKQP